MYVASTLLLKRTWYYHAVLVQLLFKAFVSQTITVAKAAPPERNNAVQ